MPIRFQTVPSCPACGSTSTRHTFTSSDWLHGVEGSFDYDACGACGTMFQSPRVCDDDLRLCYPDDYFTHGALKVGSVPSATSLAGRLRAEVLRVADKQVDRPRGSVGVRIAGTVLSRVPSVRRRARYGLLDPLGVDRPGRRCMELGPGRGGEMRQLTRLGWEVVGLDADPKAAESAEAASGCHVAVGTLADAPFAPGSFDLIYGSHVFEHLADPRDALARFAERLAPGGRLVLVYPNPAAVTARVYHGRSPVFDPPRHLVIPSARAVARMLDEAAYVDVRVHTIARRGSLFSAQARGRRRRAPDSARWQTDPGPFDRIMHAAEVAGTACRLPIGEEIVATARHPGYRR